MLVVCVVIVCGGGCVVCYRSDRSDYVEVKAM